MSWGLDINFSISYDIHRNSLPWSRAPSPLTSAPAPWNIPIGSILQGIRGSTVNTISPFCSKLGGVQPLSEVLPRSAGPYCPGTAPPGHFILCKLSVFVLQTSWHLPGLDSQTHRPIRHFILHAIHPAVARAEVKQGHYEMRLSKSFGGFPFELGSHRAQSLPTTIKTPLSMRLQKQAVDSRIQSLL